MYIIILLMCINIFICVYKSYKKGMKYALFDLIMLILFYVFFFAISMFLDMFKFNSTLIDIKIHLKLITHKYDEIIRLVISVIYKIIAFIVLYIIYPIVKIIIFKLFGSNGDNSSKYLPFPLVNKSM